jgi:hypothetical protein
LWCQISSSSGISCWLQQPQHFMRRSNGYGACSSLCITRQRLQRHSCLAALCRSAMIFWLLNEPVIGSEIGRRTQSVRSKSCAICRCCCCC